MSGSREKHSPGYPVASTDSLLQIVEGYQNPATHVKGVPGGFRIRLVLPPYQKNGQHHRDGHTGMARNCLSLAEVRHLKVSASSCRAEVGALVTGVLSSPCPLQMPEDIQPGRQRSVRTKVMVPLRRFGPGNGTVLDPFKAVTSRSTKHVYAKTVTTNKAHRVGFKGPRS